MKHLNQKPVIFLAFANDRVREGAYLRNLPEELREIRNELDKAKKAGLCEIVERANATIDDIMDVFQDKTYKNRIAVFHYGGHADSYKLLLEDFAGGPSSAYKKGLASFFAGQNSLKLIFLNACSTIQHARELNNAGIPAVIGTLEKIEDNAALILATRFYNGLANGLPIERAWREAELEIVIKVGAANTGALYQDGYAGDTDRFPWEILYKEGAEKVKEWNLPDAVHNPLFGLPGIPKTYPLPETPFLFLERFNRKHAKIFFGRSHYIRALYDRVTDKNAAPIILLYGQSGVGKSSLLEAGLLPRLEQTHTCIYLRRIQEQGLSKTLIKSFSGGQGGRFFKKAPLAAGGKKPLLIILDQVEEVYTRFNENLPNELEDFMETLKLVFGNHGGYPACKLILGFRKEYYPEIEARFKKHALPRFPVYLQPLNREDIIEVVIGLTRTQPLRDKYCLEVEDPLPVIIADDLLEDKGSPVAPTLQIILTKMWHTSKTDKFSPHREFSIKQYRELRKQGLLMEDFFKQQMAKLENWKKEAVHSGLALDLLKFHTTLLGTACTRDIRKIRRAYPHRLDIIDVLVGKLKDIYLLTDSHEAQNGNETRLAHDTLAPIVIKEYNDSDKPGQRASRILSAKIGDFNREGNNIWLDETDLKTVEQGKNGMRALQPMEKKLLEASRRRKARRDRLIKGYKIVRGVLIILVVIFAAAAAWQWDMASQREKTATANYLASQAQLKVEQNPTVALCLAEQALKMDNNPIVKRAIYKIYRENSFYKIIAKQANPVTSMAVSPDGTKVITGSPDGVVYLWDRRGKILRTFKAHNGRILSAAFSPGSNHILTGSMDGTARLWNLEGKQIKELNGQGGFVLSVNFSPDDRYILTGSLDKIVRLWDRQGELLREIKGHKGRILSAVFSHDSKFILSGSSDGSARIWDLEGNQTRVFNVSGSSVTSAAFSPDNKSAAAGCSNGKTLSWNIKKAELKQFPGHKQRVTSVCFSPNGRYILAASADKTARLFDVNGTPVQVFKGHRDNVVSAAFSPDGKYVFTGSGDKTLRLWALKGRTVTEFDGHKDRLYDVAFSPDGSQVLTGSRDRTARLWDLQGKQLSNNMNHDGSVLNAGFSPDGKRIFTRTENGKTYWWDLKGNPLHGLNRERNLTPSNLIAPGRNYTFKCLQDGTVHLFDSAGNHFQTCTGHKGNVSDVDFSPGGKYMLTGSFDNTARLWEIHIPLQDFLKTGICEPLPREQLNEY